MKSTKLRTARRIVRGLALLSSATAPLFLSAQAIKPFSSIEVHSDRTVTFAYKDAAATKVELVVGGLPSKLPMKKDETGVWKVTTPSLPPEIYGYHFEANGDFRLDPANPDTTINLVDIANELTVSGDTPQLWETTNVPHGILHHYTYTTDTVLGLPQNQSRYYVYTPPGYDPKAPQPYPVFYLLHGWSDSDSGWTAVGRAELILDNLLAQGKIKPMVVVMPLGYGDMSFIHQFHVWEDPAAIDHNTNLFAKALLTEVLPASSLTTMSRRIVMTAPSLGSPWAALKASRSGSPTRTSLRGSEDSVRPFTISNTPRDLRRSIPKLQTSAYSGSPVEPKTRLSSPIANLLIFLKVRVCQSSKSRRPATTRGWSGATT